MNTPNKKNKVKHGPAAGDAFGSLEGAVPAAEIPAQVVAAANVAAKAAGDELPSPKIDPLGEVECRGYYVPGPVPMLSRDKPNLRMAFKLVLEADMHARIAFYEDINRQLKAQLDAALAEAGKLYAVSKRHEALNAATVAMIDRMHEVVRKVTADNGGIVTANVQVACDLIDILAEDLPQEGA